MGTDFFRVCMLIPAYNESRTISAVVKGCLEFVPDVLVVDDGSNDDTATIAEKSGARVIIHEVNRGKGAALKTGFDRISAEGFDALIVIDSDGQHDWNEIPAFIDYALKNNAGIVVGNRMSDTNKMPLRRRFANWLTSAIISRLAGQNVPDSQCGYRLIMSKVLKDIELKTTSFEMESEIIIVAGRKGYRISSVPIRTIYHEGRGRIGPGRDILKFIGLFAAYFFGFRK